MPDRRGSYFAFQGLLMAVLCLIFVYQCREVSGWVQRLVFLNVIFGASLVFIHLAPEKALSRWYFQAGLFVGDAVLASVILRWTNPDSDLYLIYFLIIFGTALTRSWLQSFSVALVTSGLYLVSAWRPAQGLWSHETGFWLRLYFLWISSALMAVLSHDTRRAQKEVDHRYRERFVQFERLAALGQMAGEVAHRIKGPLTTIMVNAEVLAHRALRQPDAQKDLSQIRDEVGHCRDILKRLLDLGRIEEMDREDFDLRESIALALSAVEPIVTRRAIRLEVSIAPESLSVRGDPSLMQEAVAAVLHNAIDAVRDGGHIRLRARILRRWRDIFGGAGLCEILIEDDGPGIADEDLERIFHPFFTTKGEAGSGLGLSAALRILQKHGGDIEAFSDGPGRGARFVLTIARR